MSVRADYNTGKVAIYGNTGYNEDYVSLVVMKPSSGLDNVKEKPEIAYISQENATAAGEYNFEFSVDKLGGMYSYYVNSYFADSLKDSQFVFRNLIPEMDVISGGKRVKSITDISADKDIRVVLSGFDVPEENFEGILVLAQYSNGVLASVDVLDASKDSWMYGDEVVLDATYNGTADSIRVFYMNKNTLAPVFGTYDIK